MRLTLWNRAFIVQNGHVLFYLYFNLATSLSRDFRGYLCGRSFLYWESFERKFYRISVEIVVYITIICYAFLILQSVQTYKWGVGVAAHSIRSTSVGHLVVVTRVQVRHDGMMSTIGVSLMLIFGQSARRLHFWSAVYIYNSGWINLHHG